MAEQKRKTLEVWVLVTSDGDYEAGTDSDVPDRFEKEVGDLSGYAGFRVYKLLLSVPLPGPVELAARVPDEVQEPITLALT